MRQEGLVEGALQAKLQDNAGSKYKKLKEKNNHVGYNQASSNNGGSNDSGNNKREDFLHVSIVEGRIILTSNIGERRI